MIRFRCPKCRQVVSARDNAAGTTVACACGQSMTVPRPAQAQGMPRHLPEDDGLVVDGEEAPARVRRPHGRTPHGWWIFLVVWVILTFVFNLAVVVPDDLSLPVKLLATVNLGFLVLCAYVLVRAIDRLNRP